MTTVFRSLFVATSFLLGATHFSPAQQGNFGSLNVTNNANVGGTLTAGLLRGELTTQGWPIRMGLGDLQNAGIIDCLDIYVGKGNNPNSGFATFLRDVSVGGELRSNGAAKLGTYQGGVVLTVNSADGSVVLKKAQGDISMGVFGN